MRHDAIDSGYEIAAAEKPSVELTRDQVEEIVLANFEVLADNTLRANLSRDNHLRIIEALWDHHPPSICSLIVAATNPGRWMGTSWTLSSIHLILLIGNRLCATANDLARRSPLSMAGGSLFCLAGMINTGQVTRG